MNKIFILTIISLILSNTLFGQENKEIKMKNFYFAINIGPNFNTLRGDSFAEKYDSNINFFTGLAFEYRFKENFSILNNVNYELKSVETKYNTTVGSPGNYQRVDLLDKTEFKYLNIPIIARYYFGFENEYFINGGFFYNVLLDVTNEMTNKDSGENLSNLNFNDLFKTSDYGISIGLGTTFKLSETINLQIEIRDDLGLSDIGNTKLGGISESHTNTIKLVTNWGINL